MGLLRQFIAWIGGAVAGLSILFYAAGYLVYRAHLNMLGLNGVVAYPHEHLLYEGAKFYFTVAAYLLKTFFVVGIALLTIVIAAMLLRQVGRVEQAVTRLATAMRARIARWNERRPALLRACLLALLAMLFVLHTDRFFYPLEDLYGGIEHLLYVRAPVAVAAGCAIPLASGRQGPDMVTAVKSWLRQGEACRLQLLGEFRRLLSGYLVLLFAGYVALRYHALKTSWVYRVGTATLVVYGALYTLLLPAAFGVLVRAPVYPVVALRGGPPAFHLLQRDGQSLLVWDPAARKAAWLPADSAAVEVGVFGQANLFTPLQEASP